MTEDMIREMQEEDNAVYDEVPFESNVENEFGNIEPVKNTYVPMDSQTVDYYITSQAD